ncbi:hypothetical protein K469DRAFT_745341 [Zopfia rhizophila CBS 207.26]|uniref:Uncharacterized protein n=1 Tax=Zopfia rhizophila CBS 207.26 TaxID=1314779 RepID=A0A6A6EQ12_9PEZI|nr:hypothetical protein K469DRAFT_745341 [Zopfia rhizophila CBS 207.26]
MPPNVEERPGPSNRRSYGRLLGVRDAGTGESAESYIFQLSKERDNVDKRIQEEDAATKTSKETIGDPFNERRWFNKLLHEEIEAYAKRSSIEMCTMLHTKLPQMVEMFYRQNRFDIHDADDIEEFLTTDMFGVGIEPRQCVRKMIVAVRNDLLVRKYRGLRERGLPRDPLSIMSENLAALKTINHKNGFLLDFDIQRNGRQDSLCATMARFWPICKDLKDEGVKVRFKLDTDDEFRWASGSEVAPGTWWEDLEGL